MEQKIKSFGRGAAILVVMGMIAKLIGALYRVPLTNIIGAEGMGLYQMVFPLYTVLLAFCGGGMTSAVSRVVAKYTALGNTVAARRAVRVAILPLVATSLVLTAAVALFRNVISGVQGNTDAGIAYLALCPSLLLASGINVIRGYFQGKAKMLPGGVSQLIEQVVKLALGLYAARMLLPYGVKYAVAGALLGVTASELCALLYLVIRLVVSEKRRVKRLPIGVRAVNAEAAAEFALPAEVSDRTLLKEMYSFALSVTLGALVLPVTQMIDSALVINMLVYGGVTRGEATALFGLFVGPVGTLINMPTVVVLSVSVAVLPALTTAVEQHETPTREIRNAAKWIMLFVLPVTVVFLVFPREVCAALYSRGLTKGQLEVAAQLLRIQSVSVFYVGILQLATATLQAYNKAHRPVINLVIGACVKVGMTPLAVRAFGIIGAAGATAACYAVATALTVRSAYKCAPFGVDAVDSALKPILCSVLGALAFWGACALIGNRLPPLWSAGIAGVAFLTVYAVGVVATGAVAVKPIFSRLMRKKQKGADGTRS